MSEKHLHMARRKMSHVIDELYTALLRCGGECVELTIRREEEGLRLLARGDFSQEHQRDIQGMADILQPKVRNSALVQEFWELAGGDQYTSDSEEYAKCKEIVTSIKKSFISYIKDAGTVE